MSSLEAWQNRFAAAARRYAQSDHSADDWIGFGRKWLKGASTTRADLWPPLERITLRRLATSAQGKPYPKQWFGLEIRTATGVVYEVVPHRWYRGGVGNPWEETIPCPGRTRLHAPCAQGTRQRVATVAGNVARLLANEHLRARLDAGGIVAVAHTTDDLRRMEDGTYRVYVALAEVCGEVLGIEGVALFVMPDGQMRLRVRLRENQERWAEVVEGEVRWQALQP